MLNIDTRELAKLIARLTGADARIAGYKRAGIEHVTLIQDAMNAGGVDPDTGETGVWPDKFVPSGGWKNIPGYRRVPARKNSPRCILQDSGDLFRSINSRATESGYEVGPRGVPYAAVHQFGATITISPRMRGLLYWMGMHLSKRKNTITIPPRPYAVMPEPWKKQLGNAFTSAWLERAGGA